MSHLNKSQLINKYRRRCETPWMDRHTNKAHSNTRKSIKTNIKADDEEGERVLATGRPWWVKKGTKVTNT